MIKHRPTISIIMAVYNEKPTFLKKSISSILNQTYRDFELIIIDDGSKKKIHSLLLNYTKKDCRVTLLTNKKNLGLTKSLNIGIKKSNGRYIARMDSDDIALPQRLKKQLDFLLKNKCDLVTSNYIIIDDHGKKIRTKNILLTSNIKRHLFKGNIFAHSTFFGTKNVFKELYNENFQQAQDYEFLLRILSKGYRLEHLPNICLRYRMNKVGISFKKAKKQEWLAIKIRLLAIKKYGYNKLYFVYVMRSFFAWLLPHKLKLFLLK